MQQPSITPSTRKHAVVGPVGSGSTIHSMSQSWQAAIRHSAFGFDEEAPKNIYSTTSIGSTPRYGASVQVMVVDEQALSSNLDMIEVIELEEVIQEFLATMPKKPRRPDRDFDRANIEMSVADGAVVTYDTFSRFNSMIKLSMPKALFESMESNFWYPFFANAATPAEQQMQCVMVPVVPSNISPYIRGTMFGHVGILRSDGIAIIPIGISQTNATVRQCGCATSLDFNRQVFSAVLRNIKGSCQAIKKVMEANFVQSMTVEFNTGEIGLGFTEIFPTRWEVPNQYAVMHPIEQEVMKAMATELKMMQPKASIEAIGGALFPKKKP